MPSGTVIHINQHDTRNNDEVLTPESKAKRYTYHVKLQMPNLKGQFGNANSMSTTDLAARYGETPNTILLTNGLKEAQHDFNKVLSQITTVATKNGAIESDRTKGLIEDPIFVLGDVLREVNAKILKSELEAAGSNKDFFLANRQRREELEKMRRQMEANGLS